MEVRKKGRETMYAYIEREENKRRRRETKIDR